MNQEITEMVEMVDQSKIKTSQAITAILLLTAFVLDSWPLAAFVAAANLLGAAVPALSLFGQIYQRVIKPTGLVKPMIIPDHPEPHRFAQGFSGLCVAISAVLLASGLPLLGWLFSWMVIILAGLNVFVGFCAGCFTYYQLNRLGLPGFGRSPLS